MDGAQKYTVAKRKRSLLPRFGPSLGTSSLNSSYWWPIGFAYVCTPTGEIVISRIAVTLVSLSWLLSLQNYSGPAQSSSPATATSAHAPSYTADGRLEFPTDYRDWVFLSSGVDMSYSPMAMAGHAMFDNVFVNPEAYRSFLATGAWPDKTVLVLEVRGAATNGSINKTGHFQTTDVMAPRCT